MDEKRGGLGVEHIVFGVFALNPRVPFRETTKKRHFGNEIRPQMSFFGGLTTIDRPHSGLPSQFT